VPGRCVGDHGSYSAGSASGGVTRLREVPARICRGGVRGPENRSSSRLVGGSSASSSVVRRRPPRLRRHGLGAHDDPHRGTRVNCGRGRSIRAWRGWNRTTRLVCGNVSSGGDLKYGIDGVDGTAGNDPRSPIAGHDRETGRRMASGSACPGGATTYAAFRRRAWRWTSGRGRCSRLRRRAARSRQRFGRLGDTSWITRVRRRHSRARGARLGRQK